MAVAETNKIITHGDGQSIATSIQNIADAINDQEKNVHLSDTQTISGAKTFTSPIKTPEIDNTSGNAMLRDKSTEGAIVLGSSTKKAVIMGSSDRPTYSKDGSDFTGSELALKSDVTDLQSDKWKAFGKNRYNSAVFVDVYAKGKTIMEITDAFSTLYTSIDGYCLNASSLNHDSFVFSSNINVISPIFNEEVITARYAFANWTKNSGLTFLMSTCNIVPVNLFAFSSAFKKIDIADGADVKFSGYAQGIFRDCVNLVEIGPFDMSNMIYENGGTALWFNKCSSLKSIHCTHFKGSFSISDSTAFEEADLVEILNNLDPVSTTQTLTMGATNLAKLTSDDILIATGKGWALA